MSRKAENWLLVEWTDGVQNVVYVKSVLRPDNKQLKLGESITVNWQGEPKPAVLKERSCNRDELEAKTKKIDPGPSSEPGSNDEEEAFSASGSSWVPSDGALSNDSYNEKPAKKVKLEKTKHQYVNRRTSKRVITPSHRAKAVIPKKMQNQQANPKKNDSGRKRTLNETVQNNSLNKTQPDLPKVKRNKKNCNKKHCKLGDKELQEMGDTFRSLFQMIRELKKPFENTTQNSNIGKNLHQSGSNPHVSNPNIDRKMYQNTSNSRVSNPNIDRKLYQSTSNSRVSNPNIDRKLYQNTSNSHVFNPNIGRKLCQNTSNSHEFNSNIGRKMCQHTTNPHESNLTMCNFSYQNTSNLNVSNRNIGKKMYQKTSDPYVFNPDIDNFPYQNTSNPHVSNPNFGNFPYQNTSNPHVFNPNIDNYPYQNTSNQHESNPNIVNFSYHGASTSRNHLNGSQFYEIPIVQHDQESLVVEAFDEDEETIEYENEEFNRSDDNVLITNKYENKQYSRKLSDNDNKQFARKLSEDNKQFARKLSDNNKQFARKLSEDNQQCTRKLSDNTKQFAQKLSEDNRQCSRKLPEDNKHCSRKPVAGSSKDEEWVAIGSGKTLIPADQFRKVNWKSYTVATRTLLLAVFPRKVLATHSLTGKKSPAFQDKPAKMCLDPKIISDVVIEIQDRFDVKENLIRSIITTKCADECKMLKMRRKKMAANKGNRENEPPNVKEEKGKSSHGSKE